MSGDDPEGAAADSTTNGVETTKEKKADAKKSKKSKSGEKSIDEMFSNFGSAVEWESDGEDCLGMDGGDWATEVTEQNASPSVWDPKEFDEQTSKLDPWKGSPDDVVTRVQDLPSPALFVEASPNQRMREEDEWPFKSPCSFQEKMKRKSQAYNNLAHSVSPHVNSLGSSDHSKSKGKKKKDKDNAPAMVQRSVSSDDGSFDGDDDIIDDDDDSNTEAWKVRETWKGNCSKEVASGSRRGRKKDSEPAMPRRSRGSRPDSDEDDQPPSHSNKGSRSDEDDADVEDNDKRSRRSSRSSESEESAEVANDELGGNSFHRLAKDFDKPTKPTRSSSRGRKTKAPGSASGRRRRLKDRSSDDDDEHSEVYEEFGEDEHEIRLKDSGDASDPGSGGSKSRMSWRERRARQRLGEDSGGEAPNQSVQPLKAPGSGGGRRPPRRGLGRASSERWKRAVEGEDDSEDAQGRARAALRDANSELSRSAHTIRRHHSGGAHAMSNSLDAGSYHGPTSTKRPPMRTPRRQMRSSNPDSDGSFGNDYDDYELNLSGRSARTLDSIEDLEDFEHMDFQTPGMVDYDEEILELMQKNVPEHTAQLNRRVHRRREAVNYDQNMPMMTRQALLTRQASAQVARQRLDGSTVDRQRLLLRSDSMSSQDGGDLAISNHGRRPPGRRAPPRTKSSGMAAMARNDVPGFMQQQPARPGSSDPENRRGVFRTRSNTNSFTQYRNKPNRVSSLASRRGGDQIDPHSMRGTTSAAGSSSIERGGGERRGSLQRAKSTTSLRPARRLDPRSVPTETNADDVPELKAESKKKTDYDSSESEDSDVESIEGESVSPEKVVKKAVSPKKPAQKPVAQKPARRKPTKSASAPTKTSVPVKKTTDKRDMLNKRNRCKLHAMMYEVKMGVDMKDLFVEVQKGEIPKSPIKSLMMPSP